MKILLVEDDAGDRLLTQKTLAALDPGLVLHIVEDGEKALQFLRREGAYATMPKPDLVLLDLNLPRKDGREVLTEVRADPQLTSLPIIVLTTSKAQEDVRRCYELHANCYISKPESLEEFRNVMQSLELFWSSIARLPSYS